jgi:ribosomal protein S12
VDELVTPDDPSAWRDPATVALPNTRIITAFVPVKFTVTLLATVSD